MNPFNRDAGATPAPSDPLELEIARKAAAVVWRAVPYFAMRYGERGRKFGLSDGAWLLTLIHMSKSARIAQVEWLAGLLAHRGMPSWLLELQLMVTARIGTRQNWGGTAALNEAAMQLTAQRRGVLSDANFSEADARFYTLAGETRLARGTGRLIASAITDVAVKRCTSHAPLVDWLRNPNTFGPHWCTAVDQTCAYVTGAMMVQS